MSGARISDSLSSGSRASWRSQSRTIPRKVNVGDGPSSWDGAKRSAEICERPEGDGELLVGCSQTSGDIEKVIEVVKPVIYSKLVLHDPVDCCGYLVKDSWAGAEAERQKALVVVGAFPAKS